MEELIKKIVLKKYEVVVSRQTLISDVAEDSLSKIEFLFELEKELNVKVPQEEVLDIETFGDLIEVFKKCSH